MRALPLSIGTIHFVGIGGIVMSGIAEVLHTLGYVALCQGEYAEAAKLCAESLTLAQELNDRETGAFAARNLAYAEYHTHNSRTSKLLVVSLITATRAPFVASAGVKFLPCTMSPPVTSTQFAV